MPSKKERIKFNEIAKSAKEKNKKKTPNTRFETPIFCLEISNINPNTKEMTIGKNNANNIKSAI